MRKGIRNSIVLSLLLITLVVSYAQVVSACSWPWWKSPIFPGVQIPLTTTV